MEREVVDIMSFFKQIRSKMKKDPNVITNNAPKPKEFPSKLTSLTGKIVDCSKAKKEYESRTK